MLGNIFNRNMDGVLWSWTPKDSFMTCPIWVVQFCWIVIGVQIPVGPVSRSSDAAASAGGQGCGLCPWSWHVSGCDICCCLCVWVSVLQGNNRAGNSGLVWSGSFVSLPLPLTTSRMLPKNRRSNCTKCKLTKPSDNEPHGAKKQQQQEEHPNVSVSVSAYLCNCVSAHS